MTKLLERLTQQLQAKGMDRGKAAGVARQQLEKHGNMKDGKLTSKGKEREKMGAAGRVIDRASSYSGKPASQYVYNKKTNTATLKGK